MYSTHFNFKYMTSILINQMTMIYHRIINMNLIYVKPSIYIDFNKENNKEAHKSKVVDDDKIPKYKNIFARGVVPNLLKEDFLI